MKFIGCILMCIACSGMGFSYAKKIRHNFEEMLYLKKIIIMLRGEIDYSISVMSEAFERISNRVREPYTDVFLNFSRELEQQNGQEFSGIWNEIVVTGLQGAIGEEKDRQQLIELGENLGYLNKEMQLQYLNYYLEHLTVRIEEKREKIKGDERLCKTMGIVIGLLFVILFC